MIISTDLIGTRVRHRDDRHLRGAIVAIAYDPSEKDDLIFAVLVRTDDGEFFPANATWLVCDDVPDTGGAA